MNATEALEAIWRIYTDPEQDRAALMLWIHQHRGEIQEALDVSAAD